MTLALLVAVLVGLLGVSVTRALPNAIAIPLWIALSAILGISVWMWMPTLAPGFYGLPYVVTLIGLAGVVMGTIAHMIDMERIDMRPAITLCIVGLVWVLGLWIASWGMLRADAYRAIAEVTEKPLDADVEIIDQTHARLVDQKLAERRALELLGVEKGLGSSYSIGTPTVQMVAGKQVWVAPLEPAGFWVWLTERGAPGYVVVSATNYSDAKIVLDHPLRYTRNSWFGDNVERRAWNHAPASAQTDPSFELDDAGKPYWVVTTYAHVAGGDGPKVTGALIMDATNGKIQDASVGEQPAWVDRIQPEWITAERLELWGDYVHGWTNFSLQDVVHPTPGMSLVNLRDGRSAWFTGIVNARSQSQNSAATNGFALVDTRSGKATIYYKQGVSEAAAAAALEGAVQDKRYSATLPIAYNVHGSLAYVSTLKDFSGNPKLVGMVSALDRSVVATGQTLQDVTRLYVDHLRMASDRLTTLGAEAAPVTVEGTIVRSGPLTVEGKGYQKVLVDVGGERRQYDIDMAVPAFRAIAMAIPGDRVTLKVLAGAADGVDEVRDLHVDFVAAPGGAPAR